MKTLPLSEVKAKLSKLVDNVEQAVIATDTSGKIIFWNRFAEQLYGWKTEEVIGRPILDVTPAKGAKEQGASIMESIQAGRGWAGEFLVQRRDGSSFVAWISNTPLYDAGGQLRFSGGITPARGHAGDNAGRSAIVALVESASSAPVETPVFGCSLLDDSRS